MARVEIQRLFWIWGDKVEAIDGSVELCKTASEYTGIEVKNGV